MCQLQQSRVGVKISQDMKPESFLWEASVAGWFSLIVNVSSPKWICETLQFHPQCLMVKLARNQTETEVRSLSVIFQVNGTEEKADEAEAKPISEIESCSENPARLSPHLANLCLKRSWIFPLDRKINFVLCWKWRFFIAFSRQARLISLKKI